MRNLKYYLKRHKALLILYIVLITIQCGFGVLSTIYGARFLSTLINFEVKTCLRYFILSSSFVISTCLLWWITGLIATRFTNVVWSEIASDLTKRGFELSTSCFSENNTGSFVNRITDDPVFVLNQLLELITTILEIVSGAVTIIYMITLNYKNSPR